MSASISHRGLEAEIRAPWIRKRGEQVLRLLAMRGPLNPAALTERIVPDVGRFGNPLRIGLTLLLGAVRGRDRRLAAAASCRLVGVGPGRTPLGDDYLAASVLTVAALGGEAAWEAGRVEWLAAALPRRLGAITTPVSERLMRDAFRGVPPSPLAALIDPDADPAELRGAVARSRRIGATSGRAWASAIGATSVLLASPGCTTDTITKGETIG
jgi:hypothetical protein